MVAEAVEKPTKPRLGQNRTGSAPMIPLVVKTRVRNLYLTHGLGYKEIAAQTGLNDDQVRNVVYRGGWAKLRASRNKMIEERAIARAEDSVEEIVQAVAMESEALALGTLQSSHGVLADVGKDPDAPRNLQALSQAAKNFVGLFRQARSLDVAAQAGNTVNVLFVSCPRVGIDDVNTPAKQGSPAKAEPINVTPSAAPVTQVASEA